MHVKGPPMYKKSRKSALFSLFFHEVTANENSNDFVSWRRKLLREHIEYSCHCISVGGGMGDMLPDMMQRSTILFIKLQRDFSFSVRVSLARNVLLFWPKKVSQRENKSP